MERISVIDIGTNSILYLVVEMREDGRVELLEQATTTVRLGRGLDSDGLIRDESVDKAVDVLKQYKQITSRYGIDQSEVVGTHVFRTARNSTAVKNKILRLTGLEVEILSSADEAEWSFHGAVYGKCFTAPVCVLDIGGGSTEIILGRGSDVEAFRSLPLGSVSLTERFLHHDPPSDNAVEQLEEAILSALMTPDMEVLNEASDLIGVGGTLTSLAALEMRLEQYNADRVNGFVLKKQEIMRWINLFRQECLADRERRMVFDPDRADILPAGSMILNGFMETGAFDAVTVSDRGLRFGIALRAMQ